MEYLLYELARPGQMRAMLETAPVAYVPFGALEWHGEHGPLGLDGVKAHYLCVKAAERTGGVVFPAVFWGAFDTMPFPFTFHFERSGLARLVRSMLEQLAGMGFTAIVLLTGHYPPTQVKLLRRECERANRLARATGKKCLAVGAPEMIFAVELQYYGDHAGMWETSIMSAIAPETIDLAALPRGLEAVRRMTEQGVMGQDPAEKADAERGRKAIETIAENLSALAGRMLAGDEDAIESAYRGYDDSLRIWSPRIVRVIREALDVHSVGELVRYGWCNWRMMRKKGRDSRRSHKET